jgi:hypothetical protein
MLVAAESRRSTPTTGTDGRTGRSPVVVSHEMTGTILYVA